MPDALVLGWRQYRLERRMFWRNPSAAFFNFLLPLLFLAGGGAILTGNQHDLDKLVPSIAGHERDVDDVHGARLQHRVPARARRAQAHPRHAAADALLLRRRRRQRGHQHRAADRDRRARRASCSSASAGRSDWLELVVFVLVGVVCFAALGVAFAHVIPNFESTAAYVNAVFLPVVFVSFYVFDSSSAPGFLRTIADALPLKPLIDGLSGAMVTGRRPRGATSTRSR